MSTVSPDTSRLLHRMGIERGIEVLDVAISGSTPAAESGTVTLLGGGDAKVFEACQPIFFGYREAVFPHGAERLWDRDEARRKRFARRQHAGDRRGSRFGEKAGLDRDLLLNVLSKTAVISPAHQNKLPPRRARRLLASISAAPHEQGFQIDSREGERSRSTDAANRGPLQVNAARNAVNGDEDFSSVISEMERLARVHDDAQPASLISRVKSGPRDDRLRIQGGYQP